MFAEVLSSSTAAPEVKGVEVSMPTGGLDVTKTLPFSTRYTTSSGISERGRPRKTFCWAREGSVPVSKPVIWCWVRTISAAGARKLIVSNRLLELS